MTEDEKIANAVLKERRDCHDIAMCRGSVYNMLWNDNIEPDANLNRRDACFDLAREIMKPRAVAPVHSVAKAEPAVKHPVAFRVRIKSKWLYFTNEQDAYTFTDNTEGVIVVNGKRVHPLYDEAENPVLKVSGTDKNIDIGSGIAKNLASVDFRGAISITSLEGSKFYLDAHNRVYGPTQAIPDRFYLCRAYCHADKSFYTFGLNGQHYTDGKSDHDLRCEVILSNNHAKTLTEASNKAFAAL